MSDAFKEYENGKTALDKGVVSSRLLDCPDCAELLKLRQPNGVRYRRLPYWYQYNRGCPSCGANNDYEYGTIKIKGNPTSQGGGLMLKLVVRHKAGGGVFANAYIIPDHYNRSLETFKKLVNIARQDLGKGIDDEDFECAVIAESRCNKNQPCVRFSFDPSMPTPEGWHETDSLEFRLA